ncbi:MAG: S41 family peptidase [Bacteroidota bacterium]
MKRLYYFLLLALFFSCETENILTSNKAVLANEFWTYVDENYIYFEEKQVDWNQIKAEIVDPINENTSEAELETACINMLNSLRDGHNVLSTFTTNRVNYNYRAGYDIHFDLSVVQDNYLKGDFEQLGNYTYGILDNRIGYIHFRSFKQVSNIDQIMPLLKTAGVEGIIFDIRDNTGGAGQDAVEIVGYFIDEPTVVGYMVEKTGKAHDDVSEPLSVIASPKQPYFDVPLVLLTNRRSYSACTYLASQLKDLPNVTLVGQVTGGGGGGNQTQELSNGWLLTVSSSKLLDINFDASIEAGVSPDMFVNNDSLTLVNGVDEMLERALTAF